MRKALSFAVAGGLLLAAGAPSAAQQLTPQQKVDSTFNVNFHSIREKLRQHQQPSASEGAFAYVLDLMSGSDFFPPADWSGVPQLTTKGLVAASKWYGANKSRIEWAKLRRGLALVDASLTDEAAAELEALKIK